MKKKNVLFIPVWLVMILCIAVMFAGCQSSSNGEENASGNAKVQDQSEESGKNDEQIRNETEETEDSTVIAEGESLIIPVSEITTEAAFYPVEVDGTEMEVIAVRGSDGEIRTAFNTCQICYDSGRGYYVQQGDVFVCQNCGNQFTIDDIEIESGGCNPWPIFEQDKTTTDEAVEISYDFFAKSKDIFANWKSSYQ